MQVLLFPGDSVRQDNYKSAPPVFQPEVEQDTVYEEPPNERVIYDEPPQVSFLIYDLG